MKKRLYKYKTLFILSLMIAMIGRLLIIQFGNHWDILVNTGWSHWIKINGFKGFYENEQWFYVGPTQFPLINLIYGFNSSIFIGLSKILFWLGNILPSTNSYFVWFNSIYANTPYKIGEIISMKIVPVLADGGIALFLYAFGRKFSKEKLGFIASLIYLFSPFSIYISSLWGQYDQLSVLLLVLSFCVFYLDKTFTTRNHNIIFILSVLLYFAAVEVKPTAIFTAPLYVYLLYKLRDNWFNLFISFLVVLALALITTKPFAHLNIFVYLINDIYPQVMDNGRYFTSTHAFNFWGLVSPVEVDSLYHKFIGINYFVWGVSFVFFLNVVSIFIFSKRKSLTSLLLSLYITTMGGFLFATGVVERYALTGIVVLLVLSIFSKQIFILWILSALLFSLNLYLAWGYPNGQDLSNMFWQNNTLIRVLSLVQILLFLATIKLQLQIIKKTN